MEQQRWLEKLKAKYMAKTYDEKILFDTDWGGDDSTGGLPVSGKRVQEFIKEQLSNKAGAFYYDTDNNRYLVFSDENSQEEYLADPSKTDLVLATINVGKGGTGVEDYKINISLETPMYNAISLGSKGNYINYLFEVLNDSGMPTGESVVVTYTITRGAKTVVHKEAYKYGSKVSFNIDDYVGEGTNVISVRVMGQTSLVSTTFAITYDVINLSITDYLDISKVYDLKTNEVAYLEIPYDVTGSYTKLMEWYIDGVKVDTNRTEDEILETVPTSRVKTLELSNLSQGRHSVQFRASSKINGSTFYSDTLYRDFFVYTEANYDFMMGVGTTIPSSYGVIEGGLVIPNMLQYVSYSFKLASYSPINAAKTDIKIYLDNEAVGTITSRNGLVTKVTVTPSTNGDKTLKLSSDSLTYNIPVTVQKTDINISEITDGLKLNFSAKGRNNNASDRDVWTDGIHTATFEGFQWNKQSGWVDNRLEINNGAELRINYAPLSSHDNGKTLEFEWASKNVADENAILCDLRNAEGIGIVITATSVFVMSSNKATMEYRYKSDENVRMSVVINPDRGVNKGLTFLYINGEISKAVNVVSGDNYKSNTEISFKGTSNAGVSLKSIMIYDTALTTEQILNNYTLYRDSVEEMMDTYNSNDIYDGTSYDLSKMSNRLPVMIVTGDIPTLENTNDKDTQIVVDIEYTNMQDTSRSFVMRNAAMRPQGTSSMGYPKKNFRIYTKKIDSTTLEVNGKPVEDKLYSFKNDAIPVDCWCLKADYAESSGTHNTAIARMWGDAFKNAQVTVDLGEGNEHNTNNEYKLRTTAQQKAIDNDYPYDVRTTIDGLPILLFYRREPNADVIFLGKYNFNNDKSTEAVFGFTGIPGFDNSRMQCWELLNNGNSIGLFTDISDFYNDVAVDGRVMKGWQAAFESRYPDTKTPNTNDLYTFATWVNGVDGDAERFSVEKWNHLDVYKVAGYYCYLYRHAAADQFVKNAMLTSEDGEHFYFILYDNDTINGLNNSGDIAILPTDDRESVYANGSHKFAGHDSVLWNMLEQDEEFIEVVRAVDNALYSAGISYSNAIKYFDVEQSDKWVERVYNLDAEYKYISPYTNNGTNNLFMLQGSRSIHRRWWLSNRYSLYDSLFVSGAYKSGYVEIKCIDETMPTQRFSIKSGYPIYYGYGINGKLRQRTDNTLSPNTTHTFTIDEKVNLGDPIAIYGAPHIKELDLSSMSDRISVLQMAGVYDEALGTKLEVLKIGASSKENNTLKDISGIKSAKSLIELDVTNLKSLTALDLSENVYLQTLRASGTNIASVVFADGSPITYMNLPSSFKVMDFKSLPFLTTDGVVLDDISTIETIKISNCPNLSNDFDWIYEWYQTKIVTNEKAVLEIDNIDWKDVDYRKLLDLSNVGVLNLKGKVYLTEGSQEIINELKAVFGENVFNKTSDFYIQAPDGVYISGARKVLEGESARYICAVFSEEEGRVQFSLTTTRQGCSIDQDTGLLTTTENGLATSDIVVRAAFVSNSGKVITSTMTVTIEKRTYPTSVEITGDALINTSSALFNLTITPTNVTGSYYVEWALNDNASEYLEIESYSNTHCKLRRIKEGMLETTLTVKLIKQVNGSSIISVTKNLSLVIDGVVITKASNPGLQECLYKNGFVANEDYSMKWELALITAVQIQPGSSYSTSIFYPYRYELTNLDAFEYFTGVEEIKDNTFRYCGKINSIKIPNSVVTIGKNVFEQCLELKTVTIPNSVTSIGSGAFYQCSGITGVYIDSLDAWCKINFKDSYSTPLYVATNANLYLNNEIVAEVEVPEVVNHYSFAGCKNIQKFIINHSISKNGVFSKCTGTLHWESGEAVSNTFSGSNFNKLIIGEQVTSLTGISEMAVVNEISVSQTNPKYDSRDECNAVIETTTNIMVKGCSNTIIPDSVVSIEAYAFGNVSSLESITIPDNVTSIGNNAFRECSSLKSITLPSNLTSISSSLFYNCKSLESIIIPYNVTSIGSDVLHGCTSLKNVALPPNMESIGDYAFYGCTSLENITIPDNVTSIGNNAFRECSSLKSITLPSNLTSISSSLFYNCKSLVSITIPDNVTSIGTYVFRSCYALTSIDIPEKVASIGDSAFASCQSLKQITSRRSSAPIVSSGPFGSSTANYTGRNTYNTGENILYVPQGATGYDENAWLDPLQNADKCGFTISYTL